MFQRHWYFWGHAFYYAKLNLFLPEHDMEKDTMLSPGNRIRFELLSLPEHDMVKDTKLRPGYRIRFELNTFPT